MTNLARHALELARAQAAKLRHAGYAFGGLCEYYARGVSSPRARQSVLHLHCATNGKSTDRLAGILRATRPPRAAAPVTGFAGSLSTEQQKQIVQSIKKNGFYVFDQRLPETVCAEIERFARDTPAIVEGRSRNEDARAVFDASTPLAKKYYFPEDELVANHGMQQLMADPSLLAIAEMYLGTHPVLSDVTLWWSAVHAGTKDADAGQYYHFDFDPPPRWLMNFVYLTDVGPDNGPHVYVRSSHLSDLPETEALRRRGYVRIPDSDIGSAFGADKIVELQGKRGTVMLVDTMGFHRGMPLVSGYHLMAQLIYGFAHFAGSQAARLPVPENVHPSLSKAFEMSPRVYQKYT